MKRVLFALAALILPQSAFAGFGVTGHLGGGFGGLGGQTWPPIMSYLPTLDYHSGPELLQVDLLGLISSITTEDNIGIDAAFYHTTYRGEISDRWKGTVAPGLHVGFHKQPDPIDQTHLDAIVGLRMGAQALKEMGVGLYVVPGIGIRNVFDDKVYLAMSGGIELSVWVTGGGGD
jgi:hypothetical protein